MSSPLAAYHQNVTLHYKYLSSVRISKYVFDDALNQVTVTFQLQSNQTRAYKEYTNSYVATSGQIIAGASAMVAQAYENVWDLYHADMLAFIDAESVKPGSNQSFDVPIFR